MTDDERREDEAARRDLLTDTLRERIRDSLPFTIRDDALISNHYQNSN